MGGRHAAKQFGDAPRRLWPPANSPAALSACEDPILSHCRSGVLHILRRS
jgi:hypothetical protein